MGKKKETEGFKSRGGKNRERGPSGLGLAGWLAGWLGWLFYLVLDYRQTEIRKNK